MIPVIVFLLTMPLTVYTFAGVLQVIDQVEAGGRFSALLSLSFRLLLFALLALLTPPESRDFILISALTTLTLVLGFTFAGRSAIRSGRWPTDRAE